MTYNFDPDRWRENNLAALEHRRRRGELDEDEHRAAVELLERRYDEMLGRLDNSFAVGCRDSERG